MQFVDIADALPEFPGRENSLIAAWQGVKLVVSTTDESSRISRLSYGGAPVHSSFSGENCLPENRFGREMAAEFCGTKFLAILAATIGFRLLIEDASLSPLVRVIWFPIIALNAIITSSNQFSARSPTGP
jgi:hypothetical protein